VEGWEGTGKVVVRGAEVVLVKVEGDLHATTRTPCTINETMQQQ
jgi:hypothetical protein